MSEGIIFEEADKVCLTTGAPKSGKTYLTKSLIHAFLKQGYIKDLLIFSGSGDLNTDYSDILTDKTLLRDWDLAEFKDFIAKRRAKAHEEDLVPLLIILDDLLGVFEKDNNFLAHVLSIHRHLKLSFILTSQYIAKNVSTQLRECVNYAFIFKSTSVESREHTYKSFGSSMKRNDFYEIFDEATSVKHRCLLVNRDAESEDDRFVAYKAAPLENFKINIKKKKENKILSQ